MTRVNKSPALVPRVNGEIDMITSLAPDETGKIAWLYIMRDSDKLP